MPSKSPKGPLCGWISFKNVHVNLLKLSWIWSHFTNPNLGVKKKNVWKKKTRIETLIFLHKLTESSLLPNSIPQLRCEVWTLDPVPERQTCAPSVLKNASIFPYEGVHQWVWSTKIRFKQRKTWICWHTHPKKSISHTEKTYYLEGPNKLHIAKELFCHQKKSTSPSDPCFWASWR